MATVQEAIDKLVSKNVPHDEAVELAIKHPDYFAGELGSSEAAKPYTDDSYEELLAEFPHEKLISRQGELYRPVGMSPAAQEDLQTSQKPVGPIRSESGLIFFANGVIADPRNEQLYFPPATRSDPKEVAATPEWLERIQKDWSEDKVKEWRKKLYAWGYVNTGQGGWAQDLKDGLYDYHFYRYMNGGKPLPLIPTIDNKRAAKGIVNRAFTEDEVKTEVKAMFRETFGDDPDEAELEHWSNSLRRHALKLARRGFTGSNLTTATAAKVATEFEEDPVVKRRMDFEEENTDLADGLTGMAQILSSL